MSPELHCIFGFAKDDIWTGGVDGKIYHFDGNQWSLAFTTSIEGMSQGYLDIMGIWGSSPSNVYASVLGVARVFYCITMAGRGNY